MPPPRSPHDEFFKAVFSDLGRARDLLQGILPPEVAQLLALDQLGPEPGSFVSEALRETFSDLLFTCPLQGSQAVVAILLEHKTWQPVHPHLQVLRYMLGIWESDLSDGKPLRLVIPIVIHQGTSPWKGTEFAQSFPDTPKVLEPFVPRIHLIVEDLVQTPDWRLLEGYHDAFVQASLRIMKHIFSADGTLAVAKSLSPQLGDLPADQALRSLRILLEYILRSGDTTLRDTLIQNLHPNLKESTMTIADTLRQEGRAEGKAEAESEFVTMADTLRQEGKAEGKVEGLEQGIRATKLEDARRMLARGCDWDFITDINGIRPEDLDIPA
jgi:predicted transposase YdaD